MQSHVASHERVVLVSVTLMGLLLTILRRLLLLLLLLLCCVG